MNDDNGKSSSAPGNGFEWGERRLDLSEKVGVVTGGARGIGRATSIAFAREGMKAVAVVDQLDEVTTFVEQANAHFGREALVAFKGDVTDGAFRSRVFRQMQERFGPVGVCVPAAGFTADRLAVRIDGETHTADIYPKEMFDRVMEVDLTAPIYWAMQTVASIAEDRHRRNLGEWKPSERIQGCIVFIGSVSSSGNRGQISYATAKAGLEGAQATLAAEATYHGVRSAIIHPGFTDTAMVRVLGDQFIADHVLPQTQLKRLIQPEEIADAICFLVRNSAVSGQLWADAGWHPIA